MIDNETEGSFGTDPAEKDEHIADGTETEREATVKLTANRVFSVKYDLGEITPRTRRELSALTDADEDKQEQAMIDLLDKIVVSWDYRTRKGKAVEPTADEIAESVSLRDLSTIVSAIFQGAQSGNASEGAS